MQDKEIWKDYGLPYTYVNDYRVQVSSHGNVKVFNKLNPEGRLVKENLQEGYPIVRMKLFKKRRKNVEERIQEFNREIQLIEQERRDVKKSELSNSEIFSQVERLNLERKKIIEQRSKYIKRTDKTRTINAHFLVHRAVAELFVEKQENAEIVIHKDFNKKNNHYSNLSWETKENSFARYGQNPVFKINKMKAELLGIKGKKRGFSKLDEKDVLLIKEKLRKGKTLRSIAQRFKVSDMQIHRIKSGENWAEVKTVAEIKNEQKIARKK